MLIRRETHNQTATPDPKPAWNSSYWIVAQAWMRADRCASGAPPTAKGDSVKCRWLSGYERIIR